MTKMHYFNNDYNEMCHPAILAYLQKMADQQFAGYGEDELCAGAAKCIRKLCDDQNLAVHFLTGGTQTNLTVISSALRPHQAVLSAQTGHVNVHETGAIEATGHKIIPLPSLDGKITAGQIQESVDMHWSDSTHEHMPQPKLVYLSQPTEFGTLYTLPELTEISETCRRNNLYLFVDGARLSYALAARNNDVDMAALARLCDVFYMGGTKVGAMFGEAVVISNDRIKEDFRYIMKQHGAMLAKGWLIGLQFAVLLQDELHLKIAGHANEMADLIRVALKTAGYSMPVVNETNQIFAVLPTLLCEELKREFTFSPWETISSEQILVRFCTSWATKRESVEALCNALKIDGSFIKSS